MRDEKQEKGMQKAKININILIFYIQNLKQYNWPPIRCIQNLKTQAQRGDEKSITETFVQEKNISNRRLIHLYTVQLVIL